MLGELLARLGLPGAKPANTTFPPNDGIPLDLDLTVLARRPIRLQPATEAAVLALPFPESRAGADDDPMVSIVVAGYDNLVFTRLCLESVLRNTDGPTFELIVVDNGSRDGSAEYLAPAAP